MIKCKYIIHKWCSSFTVRETLNYSLYHSGHSTFLMNFHNFFFFFFFLWFIFIQGQRKQTQQRSLGVLCTNCNAFSPDDLNLTMGDFNKCSLNAPCILIRLLTRGHHTRSWRAVVLQSLAPTCLNTPALKIQVYQARP